MLIATRSSKIDISKESSTAKFARKFSKVLKVGDVVLLHGEIGAGKTTFIRYLINKFQKINDLKITEVTSPTFNLLNEYEIDLFKINHYDLFRLNSYEEVKNLNIFDNNINTITLIEWPQIIQEKPKNLIELIFEYGEEHQTRYVQIKNLKF